MNALPKAILLLSLGAAAISNVVGAEACSYHWVCSPKGSQGWICTSHGCYPEWTPPARFSH